MWKSAKQKALEEADITLTIALASMRASMHVSVPLKDGGFLYWWAFKPGAQYRTWYRRPFVPSEVEGRVSTSLDTNGLWSRSNG